MSWEEEEAELFAAVPTLSLPHSEAVPPGLMCGCGLCWRPPTPGWHSLLGEQRVEEWFSCQPRTAGARQHVGAALPSCQTWVLLGTDGCCGALSTWFVLVGGSLWHQDLEMGKAAAPLLTQVCRAQ